MTYYDTQIDLDSPVSHWKLDETGATTTATDRKGSHNGTYQGTPTKGQTGLLGAGDGGTSVDFNGSSQYVSIAGTSALQTSSITVEAWVNFDTIGSSRRVFTIADDCFAVEFDASSHLRVFFWNGSINRFATGTTVISTGTTYHVAGRFNSSTGDLSIVINGTADGTSNYSGQSIGWDAVTTSAIASSSGGLSASDMDGRVDEVAHYSTALSDTALQAHITAAAGSPWPPGGAAAWPPLHIVTSNLRN